jgi:uncharacterized coiled-coil protein SlyX
MMEGAMETRKIITSVLQELIVPEFEKLRQENGEIKEILKLTNKRLDDVNMQLADQSRRIDGTNSRIDATNSRIDATSNRIDAVREELSARIDETNKAIIDTDKHFRDRLDRLYEVVVRREEHYLVETRVRDLEREVAEIKQRLAA